MTKVLGSEGVSADSVVAEEPGALGDRDPVLQGGGHAGRRRSPRAIARFVVFAVASAAMYGAFFGFIDRLFPLLTAGTMAGAALLIALAFSFCLVHGGCASSLLEMLGIHELK